MAELTEETWRPALGSIVEELSRRQYEKLLENLPRIPKSQREPRLSRVKVPQMILEHYGFMESVRVIDEIMKQIPRNDSHVQDPLCPFVELLRRKDEDGTNEKKRRVEEEEEKEEEEEPATRKKRRRRDAGEKKEVQKEVQKEEEERKNKEPPAADQQMSCRVNKAITAWSSRKSIRDVKAGAGLCDTDVFIGKVAQKSGLRTYETKDDKEKFFCYLGVADETASIKVMVYGKQRYKEIEEGKTYMFRRTIRDQDRDLMKVTSRSVVSATKSEDVSDELMAEAQKLIYKESPVFLISDLISSPEMKEASVEGTVTQVDPVEQVEVNIQQKKRKRTRQGFQIQDKTGSIWIHMWGEDTEKSKGLSVGDIIKVTDLKTNWYRSQLSLNSTEFSKIHKIKSVGRHEVEMKIVGIIKATKRTTQLEVEFNQQIHTLVATSPLLAKAFDLKLDGFKDKLLDAIPLQAEAEMEGNRIKKIKAA